MKLNLGCGKDYKSGYVNVDFNEPCDLIYDLSILPWQWDNESIDEILMFDFLEHFSYRKTDSILRECWRILKFDATIEIQVPDFEHCAMAACDLHHYLCNFCGNSGKDVVTINDERCCANCKTPQYKIVDSAIARLYGGQDYEGNTHFTAFTKQILERKLRVIGFNDFEYLEKHLQWINWNFKIRAKKTNDVW